MKNCPTQTTRLETGDAANSLEGVIGERDAPAHIGRMNLLGSKDVCHSLAPGKTGCQLEVGLLYLTKRVQARPRERLALEEIEPLLAPDLRPPVGVRWGNETPLLKGVIGVSGDLGDVGEWDDGGRDSNLCSGVLPPEPELVGGVGFVDGAATSVRCCWRSG